METIKSEKKVYESPEIEVIEIVLEQCIASGNPDGDIW